MEETHTEKAIQNLEKAKENLALAGESEGYAVASSLKRDLEIKE